MMLKHEIIPELNKDPELIYFLSDEEYLLLPKCIKIGLELFFSEEVLYPIDRERRKVDLSLLSEKIDSNLFSRKTRNLMKKALKNILFDGSGVFQLNKEEASIIILILFNSIELNTIRELTAEEKLFLSLTYNL